MEGSEYLFTVAEVSVAVVGFAAIVIALVRRSKRAQVLEWLTRQLIERGLSALFFSLLPILLMNFGAQSQQAFRIASGLLSIYFATVMIRVYNVLFRVDHGEQIGTTSAIGRLLFGGWMIPVQAFAALGLLPFPVVGWYLAGVTWLLVLCAALFAAILNRTGM